MKIVRTYTAFVLLCFQSIRMLDVPMFYSDSGVLPVEILKTIIPEMTRFSVLDYLTTPAWAYFFHGLYAAGLLALMLGYFPRMMAALCFFLHISFMHRNPSIAYGIDLVATFLLFSLMFAKYTPPKGELKTSDWLGSMGRRLIQIQACVIYIYSGLEKVRGLDWWRGEALWGMLVNPLVARFDYTWTMHFPLLLIVIPTYLTLFWEIYFPVLVWVKPLRPWFLGFGVLLHLMITVSVTIPFFGLIMIAFYAAFLDDEIIGKIKKTVNGTALEAPLHKFFSLRD